MRGRFLAPRRSLPPGVYGASMDEPARLADPEGGRDALEALARDAAVCTACHLHRDATQTVFGRGPADARLVVVGEQPGDREDLAGEPFVGPSGQLLDRALDDAGIRRAQVYVTNAVKHFKFTVRGKRRIHQTPKSEEIKACRPWLDAELAAIRPDVVLALGATAAKALLGPSFRVSKQRGEVLERDGLRLTATLHPSALLRLPPDQRSAAVADFTDDLRAVAALVG